MQSAHTPGKHLRTGQMPAGHLHAGDTRKGHIQPGRLQRPRRKQEITPDSADDRSVAPPSSRQRIMRVLAGNLRDQRSLVPGLGTMRWPGASLVRLQQRFASLLAIESRAFAEGATDSGLMQVEAKQAALGAAIEKAERRWHTVDPGSPSSAPEWAAQGRDALQLRMIALRWFRGQIGTAMLASLLGEQATLVGRGALPCSGDHAALEQARALRQLQDLQDWAIATCMLRSAPGREYDGALP